MVVISSQRVTGGSHPQHSEVGYSNSGRSSRFTVGVFPGLKRLYEQTANSLG